MTKYFDWARFKEMTPRQKAGITTESTFSEQREEEKQRHPKDFGIQQMEDEVNIDWGKSVSDQQRALQKLAAADYKAEEMKDDEDLEDDIET
jgi:hypothetical protein